MATVGPVAAGQSREFTVAELAAGLGAETCTVAGLHQQTKNGECEALREIERLANMLMPVLPIWSPPIGIDRSEGRVEQDGDELQLVVTVTNDKNFGSA